MGFHFLTAPADWVTLTPAARLGMFYDEDLVGGAVTYRMNWTGQPVSDPFTYPDGTDILSTTTLVGQQAWTDAFATGEPGGGPRGHWTVTSNTLRWAPTTTYPYGSLSFVGGSADMDVTVDCRTTTGRVGLTIRDGTYPSFAPFVYLQPGQKAGAIANGSTLGTGSTTTIAADTWYTLRCVTSGTSYSVYLNGVLDMTFTHSPRSTDKTAGIAVTSGGGTATGPQFRNFARVGINHAATSYLVTNYYGDTVQSGALAGTETSLAILDSNLIERHGKYGSYDVYLRGADRGSGYYESYGDGHFLRMQTNSAFAPRLASTVAVSGVEWEVRARCQMGLGVTRLDLDISTDSVQALNAQGLADADYLVTNFVAYETTNRPRVIIGHFPDYDGTAANKARVTTTVAWLKDHGVTHWEPRNEPQGTAAATYATEQAGFYTAVKAGDASAVVLGPNPVSYANNDYGSTGLTWISTFLAAGGGTYCDQFSVHGYTDQSNIYRMMADLENLLAVLAPYGFTPDKVWQTEGGAYDFYFGSFRPQSQIMQILALELVGVPWQQNSPWYDQSHGFWDFPSFWLTTSSSYAPGLAPRTFISEIGDRVLEERFDFGAVDDLIYLGGVWVGGDGSRTVAVRAENSWLHPVTFRVTGATSMTAVDLFGNTFALPVTNDRVSLPADPDIIYLRVPAGVTCELVPRRQRNTQPTLTITAPSGSNNVSNLANGVYEENWPSMVATPTGANKPYNSKTQVFPHSIELAFAETEISQVLVMPLTTGHQWSPILDIDIDVWADGAWQNVYTQTNPPGASFRAYTYESNCRWHEAWEPTRAFDAVFASVVTTKVRVTVNEVGYGAFATVGAYNGWWEEYGQAATTWFAIRDVGVYEGQDRERFALSITTS